MSVHPSILLEHLGLPHAAAVLEMWLARAAQTDLSYADFLHNVFDEELVARQQAATERRLQQANFPFAATIEQFDCRFRPELKRQVVLRCLDASFVEQANCLQLPNADRGTGLGQDDAGDQYRHEAGAVRLYSALRDSPAFGSADRASQQHRSAPTRAAPLAEL